MTSQFEIPFRWTARFLEKVAAVLWLLLALSVPRAEAAAPDFSMSFSPGSIGSGAKSTLTFTITNEDRVDATSVAFTHTLPAGLLIATPAEANTDCQGATLTAPNGSSTITLSGGTVAAGTSCTVRVKVTGSTQGSHLNVSGDLTSSLGNSGPASATLTVGTPRPIFSMSFSPGTINVGQRSRLTYTFDNTANAREATFVSFNHSLPAGLVVAAPANAVTDANGAFPASITATPGSRVVGLQSGTVAASSSRTVAVDVGAIGAGVWANVVDATFNVNFENLSAQASSSLTVNATPFTAIFTDDPATPGGTANLRIILKNLQAGEISGLTFTCDLGAALAGLVATGLPRTDVCGVGSQLSGTSLLTFTGGRLVPGASCTIDIPVQIPPAAVSGSYSLTTSALTGTIAPGMDEEGRDTPGGPLNLPAASETLLISAAPHLTMNFLNDPAAPGATTTLEFTITNTDSTNSATDVEFTLDIGTPLPSATVAMLPAAGYCGAGSQVFASGGGATSNPLELFFTGGDLGPGAVCTFQVTLNLASDAPAGVHVFRSTAVTATINAETRAGAAASETLTVMGVPRLTKAFAGPVAPGGLAKLEYTLHLSENATADATAITFTDDLGAVIPGLVAVGLPKSDVAGTGSQVSGTSLITFTGGTLTPGTTRKFTVDVQVPATAAPGAYPSTSSSLATTVSGFAVTAPPAVATLEVLALTFTRSFIPDAAPPGGPLTLRYTITNIGADAVTALTFTDDLQGGIVPGSEKAPLPGLAATGLPATDVCGAGSQISGTSVVSLTGGSLAAGQSCVVDVIVRVPPAATAGSYANLSGNLSGVVAGNPVTVRGASAEFSVTAPFAPITRVFAQGKKPFDFNVLARAVPGSGVAVSMVTDGASGTVTINPDGTLRYTPTGTLPPGGDSFSFDIAEGANPPTSHVLTITNFGALAGSLDGLVGVAGTSAEQRGYVQFKVTKTGSFSGKLTLLGKATGIRGQFDALGEATLSAKRGKLAPLAVTVALGGPGDPVSGKVTTADDQGVAFTSEFSASPKTPAGALACAFTALLQRTEITAPAGTGYAILTVKADGSVRAAGKLSDGTSFKSGSFLHADQTCAIYSDLYSKLGSVGGLLTFDLGAVETDATAGLDWFKPERSKDVFQPNGFTTQLRMILARYVKPKGTPVLDFGPAGTTTFGAFDGGLLAALAKDVTLSVKNKFTVTPAGPDKTKLTVSVGSGLLSGSFVHAQSGKATAFKGVVLQKTVLGQGYFLDKASRESGGVQLGRRAE